MLNKQDVYKKIKDVFPDIGDLDIRFDIDEHAWVVDLKEGRKHLKTYLEEADADRCVHKNVCFGLGFQISQLKDNLELL